MSVPVTRYKDINIYIDIYMRHKIEYRKRYMFENKIALDRYKKKRRDGKSIGLSKSLG